MKFISTAVLAFSLMTGCSAIVMPDENYQQAGAFAGSVQRCYEAGYINSSLHQEAQISLAYWMNTWIYDQDRFNTMMAQSYKSISPNRSFCSSAEKSAYELISATAHLRNNAQMAYQAQASQAQAQQFFQQQLQQTQQMNNALLQGVNSTQQFNSNSGYAPVRFYTPDECFGTIVNGQCNGTISPAAKTRYCHGTIVNGACVGTVTGGQ